MAELAEIVAFLDRELKVSSIPDYPGAMNGLQLANEGRVDRIVAAVDASLPVIEAAAAGGPGLLIVHHGMFWQGAQPVTGAFYRKLKTAMEAGLAVYSSHLPLDVHPDWGNNILLAKAIGCRIRSHFSSKRAFILGLRGGWTGSRNDLAEIAAARRLAARFTFVRAARKSFHGGPDHRRSGKRSGQGCRRRAWTPLSPARAPTGVTRWPRNWGSMSSTVATTPPKPSVSRPSRRFCTEIQACRGVLSIIPLACESTDCEIFWESSRGRMVRVTGIEPVPQAWEAIATIASSRRFFDV